MSDPKPWTDFLPVIDARDLGQSPVKVLLEDEALALFRDRVGAPGAVLDRCPHRFASLSEGRVRDDGRLACPYHGWNFDRAGCGKSPSQPERTDCDTTAYVVVERHGIIWIAPPGCGNESTMRANESPVGEWIRRPPSGLARKLLARLPRKANDPPEVRLAVATPSRAGGVRFRRFVVAERVEETADITSWVLAPASGPAPDPHRPGQHVTICLTVPDHEKPVIRSYSLSDTPSPKGYRISVKRVREPGRGIASNHLHDRVFVGGVVELAEPAGTFHLPEADRPLLLLAAGVGITPLFCMLRAWVDEKRTAPVWLRYGVRTPADVFRRNEIETLAKDRGLDLRYYVSGKGELPGAAPRWSRGRVSVADLKDVLAKDPEIFMCGPDAMMASLERDLLLLGVRVERIHVERFGRARTMNVGPLAPATVTFARSKKKITWTEESGTLLELATEHGIVIDSGCQVGSCGTCLTRVKDGVTLMVGSPQTQPGEGACFACIAVPKGDLTLDA